MNGFESRFESRDERSDPKNLDCPLPALNCEQGAEVSDLLTGLSNVTRLTTSRNDTDYL